MAKKTNRLSKEVRIKREEYVIGLFMSDPNLSIPKMNEMVASKFKNALNTQKAYKLRVVARAKLKANQNGTGTLQAAARGSEDAQVPGTFIVKLEDGVAEAATVNAFLKRLGSHTSAPKMELAYSNTAFAVVEIKG